MTAVLPRGDHGDAWGEYRALREDAAIVAPAHDLLWVAGGDAVSFLQGLVSQDVESMEPGSVARSFLLGPQGKLAALIWLLRGDDRVGVVTDRGWGSNVAVLLDRYRIRVDAVIEADPRPLFEIWGARVETSGWRDAAGELVAGMPLPALGRELRSGTPPTDLVRAGTVAVTAVRIEEGEPIMGRDVDEGTIPQETGLVAAAVSFTKGCYLGQELVARIETRGHVNRHLRGVVVTRNVVPPEGAEVWAGDRPVGTLTSVGESPGVGAPVGLALLRREVVPDDDVLVRWDGGEAPGIVRALPMSPKRT